MSEPTKAQLCASSTRRPCGRCVFCLAWDEREEENERETRRHRHGGGTLEAIGIPRNWENMTSGEIREHMDRLERIVREGGDKG